MQLKEHKKNCSVCGSKGFTISTNGYFASAKKCDCRGDCLICNGLGFIFKEDSTGYEVRTPCSCQGTNDYITRYNDCKIPSKYANAEIHRTKHRNDSLTQAMAYALQFCEEYPNVKQGFLFLGDVGVGKTYLTAGILSYLIQHKHARCRFVDFYHLLSDLRSAYTNNIPENDIINPLISVDVLAIDELGKGKNNEWEVNILDQLISKRYNMNKLLILTTNFKDDLQDNTKKDSGNYLKLPNNSLKVTATTETLRDRVGDRIYSRIKEMCKFLEIKGTDYRDELF